MTNFKLDSSLILVGSGIKFLSHLTTEAKTYITESDKVLYLVNDPAMKKWIEKANPNSESLDPIYNKYLYRMDSYSALTDHILETLQRFKHICVVLYGHPCVFSNPGLEAIRLAQQKGYYTKVLPGISAEACLFSDLYIDPGSCGCQSFEATDFLLHQRKFDPTSHLIIWQVDIIGSVSNPINYNNSKGLLLLKEYLKKQYKLNHSVVLYEASQYPGFDCKIEKTILSKLNDLTFSPISLLYMPPIDTTIIDQNFLKVFEIKNSPGFK